MKLDYLRYFEQLAQTLSYTKAAEELYIAQPTLSAAIKRMEGELGFPLFHREAGSARMELTESGAAFLEYASLALRDYQTGVRIAREKQGELNSSIHVGTIYAMQGRFWSHAIQAFSDQCAEPPHIAIEQAYSPQLIERLRRRDLDVAFASRVKGSEGLDHVLVWSQPLVLGVHRDNPLAQRRSVSIDDLRDRDIITYGPASPTSISIDESLPVSELNLQRDFVDEITMCSLVTSNKDKMALFCYSFLVTAFEDVVCLPIRDLPVDFHKVYLVSRHETHPKIVADFIAFMGSYRFPNVMS